MAFRVELTRRATRDLRCIYEYINAANSDAANDWFNGLEEAVLSLGENPARCPMIPEGHDLRHLLYGSRRNIYRIIFDIDEVGGVVTILHIRHGAQARITSRP